VDAAATPLPRRACKGVLARRPEILEIALAPRRERPIKNAFASSGFAPSLEIRKGSGIGCDNVSYPKSCHFFKMNSSDY